MAKSKKEMIGYILDHDTHCDRFRRAYAHNVRIDRMRVDKKTRDFLWQVIGDEGLSHEFFEGVAQVIDEWRENNADLFGVETKYDQEVPTWYGDPQACRQGTKYAFKKATVRRVRFDVGFEGRSGGWLALYHDRRPFYVDPDELQSLEADNVRWTYKVIVAFDRLLDDICKYATSMAETMKIEEETYTVEKKRKVLVEA